DTYYSFVLPQTQIPINKLEVYESSFEAYNGNYNKKWRTNFDQFLVVSNASQAILYRPSGERFYLTESSGVYINDQHYELSALTNTDQLFPGWKLKMPSGEIEYYNQKGKILRIEEKGGYTVNFVYSETK